MPAEKRNRYLTNGLLEAERLERGLHNVLTAAGLRSAGKAMRPSLGNLADEVRQAVEAMQARALAAEVELQVNAPDTVMIERDAAALQLVLRNLIDNAVKFSPSGTTVHVLATSTDHEARVTVRDSGRGLDDSELQHAFEPFFRGDDTASGGTGLGLHLVHEMVLAHGGSATAESEGRDRGSAFTVRLPISRKA